MFDASTDLHPSCFVYGIGRELGGRRILWRGQEATKLKNPVGRIGERFWPARRRGWIRVFDATEPGLKRAKRILARAPWKAKCALTSPVVLPHSSEGLARAMWTGMEPRTR